MTPSKSQRIRFIDDYLKLRDTRHTGSAGRLLDVSAILRRWFLDSPALAHEINRQYRFKLVFKTVVPSRIEESQLIKLVMAGDSIDPDGPPDLLSDVSNLKLDDFLKLPVVQYSKSNCIRVITVKDVILFTANSAGGVHSEHYQTSSSLEAVLEELNLHSLISNIDDSKTVKAEHIGLLMRNLRPISNIVANAVQELYEALIKDYGFPDSLEIQ